MSDYLELRPDGLSDGAARSAVYGELDRLVDLLTNGLEAAVARAEQAETEARLLEAEVLLLQAQVDLLRTAFDELHPTPPTLYDQEQDE